MMRIYPEAKGQFQPRVRRDERMRLHEVLKALKVIQQLIEPIVLKDMKFEDVSDLDEVSTQEGRILRELQRLAMQCYRNVYFGSDEEIKQWYLAEIESDPDVKLYVDPLTEKDKVNLLNHWGSLRRLSQQGLCDALGKYVGGPRVLKVMEIKRNLAAAKRAQEANIGLVKI